MDNRVIEERFEFPNGIKGEWEPSQIKPESNNRAEVQRQIRQLNKQSREEGSAMRYRSRME